MSLIDNRNFGATFPFSPSGLRDLVAEAGEHLAPVVADLAPQVARRPAPLGRAVPPSLPARLLPLAAFVWGSRALPPQPRTRADHTLIWVTGGRMHLDYPRHHHRMLAGDLRFVPAGTAFAALPMQGAKGHVALLPAALTAHMGTAIAAGIAAQVGPEASRLLALLRGLTRPDPATTAQLAAGLAACLGGLAPERTCLPDRPAAAQDRGLVERFLDLAGQRLGDGGSLAELASELHSSMAMLDRACIAARGRRAIDLVHDMRLEHAVRSLRQGTESPARIAVRLGYTSHAHLTCAFIAATGRTPEAFRAQPGRSSS